MLHKMKLQPKYFNYIKNGTKEIELRLYDEKRKAIKLGDEIEFQKEPDLYEIFTAKVVGLLNYENFSKLFEDFDISKLADKAVTKEEVLNDLQSFYTEKLQKEYGVLGIKIEK